MQPQQSSRSLSASIAANTRWAAVDNRAAATQVGRDAFMARFEQQVDPDGTLAPEERAKRAANARKAHFQRLALASAKARSRSAKDRQRLAAELRAAAAELDAGGAEAS